MYFYTDIKYTKIAKNSVGVYMVHWSCSKKRFHITSHSKQWPTIVFT